MKAYKLRKNYNELIGIIKEKDKQIEALHKIIEKLSS